MLINFVDFYCIFDGIDNLNWRSRRHKITRNQDKHSPRSCYFNQMVRRPIYTFKVRDNRLVPVSSGNGWFSKLTKYRLGRKCGANTPDSEVFFILIDRFLTRRRPIKPNLPNFRRKFEEVLPRTVTSGLSNDI